jgi:hypothetical protein
VIVPTASSRSMIRAPRSTAPSRVETVITASLLPVEILVGYEVVLPLPPLGLSSSFNSRPLSVPNIVANSQARHFVIAELAECVVLPADPTHSIAVSHQRRAMLDHLPRLLAPVTCSAPLSVNPLWSSSGPYPQALRNSDAVFHSGFWNVATARYASRC